MQNVSSFAKKYNSPDTRFSRLTVHHADKLRIWFFRSISAADDVYTFDISALKRKKPCTSISKH